MLAPRIEIMRGAIFVKNGRKRTIGCCAVCVGVIIILSIVLPGEFWWFMLAGVLIAAGIWYLRCC